MDGNKKAPLNKIHKALYGMDSRLLLTAYNDLDFVDMYAGNDFRSGRVRISASVRQSGWILHLKRAVFCPAEAVSL